MPLVNLYLEFKLESVFLPIAQQLFYILTYTFIRCFYPKQSRLHSRYTFFYQFIIATTTIIIIIHLFKYDAVPVSVIGKKGKKKMCTEFCVFLSIKDQRYDKVQYSVLLVDIWFTY